MLRSFGSAKWSGAEAPAETHEHFEAAMSVLEQRLNENRLAGRRLDRIWGRLAPEVVARVTINEDPLSSATTWWRNVSEKGSAEFADQELSKAIDECR